MNRRSDRSILIIEDDTDIQNFISRVLELEGYPVLKAFDGKRGMELVRETSVDMVLLDLLLPGIDGWEVLREIKEDKELSKIPVVVITAVAESIQRKRALRMGVAGYITKPLGAQLLIKTVVDVLGE